MTRKGDQERIILILLVALMAVLAGIRWWQEKSRSPRIEVVSPSAAVDGP